MNVVYYIYYIGSTKRPHTEDKKMTYVNQFSGTAMTVKQVGKSFIVTLSHEATKNSKAEEKTMRLRTFAAVEKMIKRWNLDAI